jgi:hypothetical protein
LCPLFEEWQSVHRISDPAFLESDRPSRFFIGDTISFLCSRAGADESGERTSLYFYDRAIDPEADRTWQEKTSSGCFDSTSWAPLVEVLKQLPVGSTALVGVNADNLYAILNGLGVPVAGSGNRCEIGSTCVPCFTNHCFPVSEFDHLWLLIRDENASAPQLVSLRYGNVPPLPAQ